MPLDSHLHVFIDILSSPSHPNTPNMDAASIEEANKLRVSLGMKPLPVPGQAKPSVTFKEPEKDGDDGNEKDDPGSTLESREAQAYENYRAHVEAQEAKRRREERAAAIKKARDASKRFVQLDGKGLGDLDGEDVDTKSWLKSQKKRQKKIEDARKAEEERAAAEAAAAKAREYSSKDLAGVKVAHDISSFLDGEEQILTLKDSTIQENEEEGDELENIALRDEEKLKERLEVKKKKVPYNPIELEETGERSILAQYDEEISGKKKKVFTLDAKGGTDDLADIIGGSGEKEKGVVKVTLDAPSKSTAERSLTQHDVLTGLSTGDVLMSDYLEPSEIKVKKPKKKSKSTRHKVADEDDIFHIEEAPAEEEMDVDSGARKRKRVTDDNFVDDEDLQAALSIQRQKALKQQRKKVKPEDLARQLKQEAQTPEADGEASNQAGLVIDDVSEFVAGIRRPGEDEDRRVRRKSKTPKESAVTSMEVDSDSEDDRRTDRAVSSARSGYEEEEQRLEGDITAIGVDEEKAVGSAGIGAALQLLRERGILKQSDPAALSEAHRQRELFLADLNRQKKEFEAEARRIRERERASGKLDRMTTRERDEWLRQQNVMRDYQASRIMAEVFNKHYKPNVELKYVDEFGRHMDQKEAFKHLSHQFHGKGSGKGKTDKHLKKIEEEKRREAQSILDVSEAVGMSSATAQQTKKRKEAGVRLM